VDLSHEEVAAAAERIVQACTLMDREIYFDGFDPSATFIFHSCPSVLTVRTDYESAWDEWVRGGWRILSCQSHNPLIRVAGETAVFTHDVETHVEQDRAVETLHERETIVFARQTNGAVVAIREHLSLNTF
jgi:ketosteroid isomerase-like protein